MEMYLACNAAVNKHARAIIEHKARMIYARLMTDEALRNYKTPPTA